MLVMHLWYYGFLFQENIIVLNLGLRVTSLLLILIIIKMLKFQPVKAHPHNTNISQGTIIQILFAQIISRHMFLSH